MSQSQYSLTTNFFFFFFPPKYYCSFYQFGTLKESLSGYAIVLRKEFAHLKWQAILVMNIKEKLAVHENDHPIGWDMPSYSNIKINICY